MSRKTPAIVYEAINKVAIRQVELAECGPGDLLCETIYTFVSPGTELRVLGGHYGAQDKFPFVPGYSAVGRVVAVGKEVQGYRVGDLVSGRNPAPLRGINSVWGGQTGWHVYHARGEDLPVLLPAGANPLDYVVAEVSAISLRGIEGANPVRGETAIVIGQGMIGAFSAAWLMDRGCRVIVTDMDEARLAKARERGVAAAVNMGEPDAMARLATLTNGGADIVVESSGSTPGVLAAYQLARKKPQAYGTEYKVEPIAFYHGDWPRVVLQANYIENISVNPFSLTPGEGVILISPRDRGVEDRQKAVEAIRAGRLRAADFIDAVLPYSKAKDGYAGLQNHRYSSVTYRWGKGDGK